MPMCHFQGKNLWIMKLTSLNRGQGIHVVSSFKKIKKLIRDYCRGREVGVPENTSPLKVPTTTTTNTNPIGNEKMDILN